MAGELQQLTVKPKTRLSPISVQPGELVTWTTPPAFLGTSPAYQFNTEPKYGYPFSLRQIYMPFFLGTGVPAGTTPMPTAYPVVMELRRNEVVVWTRTIELPFSLLVAGMSDDDYGGQLTIAEDFNNPIPYRSGETLRFEFTINNILSVAAGFIYGAGQFVTVNGANIESVPSGGTLAYVIES